uniref:SBBP repeat-containing protein n=1 Tax=Flavobacterium sp. TaxID=239 RepID=UPI00404A4B7D
MKRILLSLVAIATISLSSFGQDPTFEWVNKLDGNNSNSAVAVSNDALGNVYTTGWFNGTVDFDPGVGSFNLTSFGGNDIYISKCDASGNFIWAIQIGGTGNENAKSIEVDNAGNSYITGDFYNSVDFDPGANSFNMTPFGSNDVFVCKYDPSGDLLWAKQLGGASTDKGISIDVDLIGNVIVGGEFNATCDFDPGANSFNMTSYGGNDIFVTKLDGAGNFIWAKQIGGSNNEWNGFVDVDVLNNIIVTGEFNNTIDLDPGGSSFNVISVGSSDVFITKLSSAGGFVWGKQIGGSQIDAVRDITTDANNNVYLTGFFSGTSDFDPGMATSNLTSQWGYDQYVLKLDDLGSLSWVSQLGNMNNAEISGYAIDTDASGNVYTTGQFSGTIDLDPGPGNATFTSTSTNTMGGGDLFVSKLNASGAFSGANHMSGTDDGRGLSLSTFGNTLYVVGDFYGTLDFDPGVGVSNLTTVPQTGFIEKLNTSTCVNTSSSLFIDACDTYVAPSGAVFNMTGIYTDIIPNSLGCDSVITIALTMGSSNTGTDVITACNSYTWIDGNTYSSSTNSPTWTLLNSSGCDSVVTLNLTINQGLDVTVTQNGAMLTANETGVTYQWLDCDNNYAVINGETNQFYNATITGNYAVQISSALCVDTSQCILVDFTGIDELTSSSISVYPNPSNDGYFSIELAGTITTVVLYDMLGRIIEVPFNVEQGSLDASSLEAGKYIISINSNDGVFVEQIVIAK